MKTDKEVQNYFFETGMFSYNGVLDDCVFGNGDEWYTVIYERGINRQPEPYAGPFKTYEEACKADLISSTYVSHTVTGYIYTEWNNRERERVRKVREERDSKSTSQETKP